MSAPGAAHTKVQLLFNTLPTEKSYFRVECHCIPCRRSHLQHAIEPINTAKLLF